MATHVLKTPLCEEDVRALNIGDIVTITGHIFTARDMVHLKMISLQDQSLPFSKDLNGSVIFHAGPVAYEETTGNWKLNVIGPTTSIRMEPYASFIGQQGVRAIIGKGGMGKDTLDAASQYGYVYLQAAPGCAAKLAQGIEQIHDVTWLELGMPEAMWDLVAYQFGPLIVGMDTHHHSIYQDLKENALKKLQEIYPCA